MSTRGLPGDEGRPALMDDNRHLLVDYLENVGASTSHNPMALHGLLQGQLTFTSWYIYIFISFLMEGGEQTSHSSDPVPCWSS
jgi:hypothetical protein